MRTYKDHLIRKGSTIKQALTKLNVLASDAILFVTDEQERLIGSLTDGDVRRGLLKDFNTNNQVEEIIQSHPRYIQKGSYDLQDIIAFREGNLRVIPILDEAMRVINVINFRLQRSYLPLDAVVMAGGRGSRLSPLTDSIPKPLLKVGEKAIIDHNVDRLRKFGIYHFWISVRYLGEQLEVHYRDGSSRNISVKYVWEDEPLGTIGAVSKIKNFQHDYVLITNSDILTTLDYESFFLDFLTKKADMSVVTIPYYVKVPYAVMETTDHQILSFKEKPTYTYYSNGGIYLVKKEVLHRLPKNQFYNTTDLMEDLIINGGKLISYPIRDYWLDVGKPEDYEQAQKDIKHLDLK